MADVSHAYTVIYICFPTNLSFTYLRTHKNQTPMATLMDELKAIM